MERSGKTKNVPDWFRKADFGARREGADGVEVDVVEEEEWGGGIVVEEGLFGFGVISEDDNDDNDEEEGCMGAEFGSGSASTKKGDMNALPDNNGVDGVSSASMSAWFGHAEGEETGKSKQPTVNRGSCRMSLSSCESGLKSVRRIWRIGGGSTGRRSRSPAPQARAAMGCWRM